MVATWFSFSSCIHASFFALIMIMIMIILSATLQVFFPSFFLLNKVKLSRVKWYWTSWMVERVKYALISRETTILFQLSFWIFLFFSFFSFCIFFLMRWWTFVYFSIIFLRDTQNIFCIQWWWFATFSTEKKRKKKNKKWNWEKHRSNSFFTNEKVVIVTCMCLHHFSLHMAHTPHFSSNEVETNKRRKKKNNEKKKNS